MKLLTYKMEPERLKTLNALVSGKQESTEPRGTELLWLMFKVGGVIRLVVEVRSCGPGERAAVSTHLYRKISEDEYERINSRIPDRLPLDREHYSIDYEGKEYRARIESA